MERSFFFPFEIKYRNYSFVWKLNIVCMIDGIFYLLRSYYFEKLHFISYAQTLFSFHFHVEPSQLSVYIQFETCFHDISVSR